MAGTTGSFSLIEKLAVAGAFLAVVALGVGTEDDPGVVVEQTEQIASRAETAQAAPPPPAASPTPTATSTSEALPPETPAIYQGELDEPEADADAPLNRPEIDMRQRLLSGG